MSLVSRSGRDRAAALGPRPNSGHVAQFVGSAQAAICANLGWARTGADSGGWSRWRATPEAKPPLPARRGTAHGGHFRPNVKHLTPRRAIRIYGVLRLQRPGAIRRRMPRRALQRAPTWSAHHGWRGSWDISQRIDFCGGWSGPVGGPRAYRIEWRGARERGRAQSPLGRASADGRRA